MSKIKMLFVTSLVTLTALAGVAAAKNSPGHRAGKMQKFDANGDGKLDDAERAKARATMRAMHAQKQAQRLAQFDSNRNGVLDPAEKQAMHDKRASERFAKLDTNKDGRITLDEFKAAKHGRMGKRGRGPKQP